MKRIFLAAFLALAACAQPAPVEVPVTYAVPPASAIDVLKYGALCNGKKDDAPAIRKALAAVKRNGSIKFPSGRTCIVGSRLDLPGYLDWYGQGSTLKAIDGMPVQPDSHILSVKSVSYVDIFDQNLDGNRSHRAAVEIRAMNLSIVASHFVTVTRAKMIECVTDCIRIGDLSSAPPTDANYPTDITLTDVVNDHAYRNGITINNGYRITIHGGSYINTAGTWPQAGIDIEPNKGTAIPGAAGVVIEKARFTDNAGLGVAVAGPLSSDITVANNYFARNGRGGVRWNAEKSAIRDNLMENFTTVNQQSGGPLARGIVDVTAAGTNGANTISGNTIRDVRWSGGLYPAIYVHSQAGAGNKVTSNCTEAITYHPDIVVASQTATVAANQSDPAGGCSVPTKEAEDASPTSP